MTDTIISLLFGASHKNLQAEFIILTIRLVTNRMMCS